MALRYVGLQISQAREETGETDYSTTNGVPQSVPLQALREAVIHCQNSLYLAYPKIFDVITEIDAVAGQSEYDLPANTYLGSSIASAEYSKDGDSENFLQLSLIDFGYRLGGTGYPSSFIPYGDAKIIVDPAPSLAGGSFRIAHSAHLDEPDLRRGKIKTITKDGPMTNYVSIELEDDSILDEDAIALHEYLCVNDKDGVVKYYNANFTSYDASSNTLTLAASTPVSAGTIAIGDYITLGKYTTTHVKLDRIADPVIMAFVRRRFYLSKSSEDVKNEEDNIAAFTKEMVAAYKRAIRTQKKIPFTGRFEFLGRRV